VKPPPINPPPPVKPPPITGKPIGSIWEEFVKSIKYGQSMLKAYEHWFSEVADIYDSFVKDVYAQFDSFFVLDQHGNYRFRASVFARHLDEFFQRERENRRVASAETKDQLKRFFAEIGITVPESAFKQGSDGGWYVLLKDVPDHPANKLFEKMKEAVISASGAVYWPNLLTDEYFIDGGKDTAVIARFMAGIESAMSRFEEQMQLYGQKYADMHSKFENLNKTIASMIQIMADMAQSIVRNI
jgi:hypothetical protein